MRAIEEVLRLRWEAGLSRREIGLNCRLGATTVRDYLLPAPSVVQRPVPEWARLHQELRRKGMTLGLLWQEYREVHPDGYGYSQFCEL
jgi:transposase